MNPAWFESYQKCISNMTSAFGDRQHAVFSLEGLNDLNVNQYPRWPLKSQLTPCINDQPPKWAKLHLFTSGLRRRSDLKSPNPRNLRRDSCMVGLILKAGLIFGGTQVRRATFPSGLLFRRDSRRRDSWWRDTFLQSHFSVHDRVHTAHSTLTWGIVISKNIFLVRYQTLNPYSIF